MCSTSLGGQSHVIPHLQLFFIDFCHAQLYYVPVSILFLFKVSLTQHLYPTFMCSTSLAHTYISHFILHLSYSILSMSPYNLCTHCSAYLAKFLRTCVLIFPYLTFHSVIPHILFRHLISFTFKIICYSHTQLYSKSSATPILSTFYVVDTTIPSIQHSHYIHTDCSTLKQSAIQRSENIWTFGCGTGIPPAGATSPLVTSCLCFSNPALFPYPLSVFLSVSLLLHKSVHF